jgi:hypothetical protein
MTELPSSFYAIAGILVISNFGIIITFIGFIFKTGQYVANTKRDIKDAKDASTRAHKRIDRLEANQ